MPLIPGPSLQDVVGSLSNTLFTRVRDAYEYLTDGEVAHGPSYSVLRHTRPIVAYQGTKTQVQVTVFGEKALPPERRVFLQRRGYRTALFGWTIGGLLGGSKLPGIEVTPAHAQSFNSLPSSRQSSLLKDESRLFSSSETPNRRPLQTISVHIPVASGDGYFRLRITREDPKKTLAESPAFRVGSLSWASAHPQGASLLGLIPELLVKTSFVTAKTAAYASFYAAFPFLKLAQYTPGPWRRYALRALYSNALTPDQQEQFSDNIAKGKQQIQRANESIYSKVPFGAVGVRTLADLQKDEEMGRGGVWVDRTKD